MSNDRVCDIDGCAERADTFDRDGGLCRLHADERDAQRRAEEQRVTEEAGGPWPHLCPRRVEDGALDRWVPPDAPPGMPDTWAIREQMHQGLRARHCSYCGSLHPDDFMEKVREGWTVGATDKNYKAYLGAPVGGSPGSGMESKFYFQHLSDEQKREFVEMFNAGRIHFGDGGSFYRLPYFMARA